MMEDVEKVSRSGGMRGEVVDIDGSGRGST